MSEAQSADGDFGYECEACGESIAGIVEIIQHGCSPVRLSASSLSRRERNTLLYIENRVVDHGGKLDTAQMNHEDHQNIKLFEAAGLLNVADAESGHPNTPGARDPNAVFKQVGYFSDEAWDLNRDCRQMRAMQDSRVNFAVGDEEDTNAE